MPADTDAPVPTGSRSPWRAVAVPSEHGGWGLTLEPVLLGMLVAPSVAGALIGAAAFGVFLARTPAKLVVVDRRRHRWLDRSRLAARVAAGELALVVLLAGTATWLAGWRWWAAVVLALPLAVVEWFFDVRSRGRRLLPELCGAVGVAASSAAIVLAAGATTGLAVGVWLVLAARSVGAIPFVRAQIVRLRRGVVTTAGSDVAQAASLLIGIGAVAADRRMLAGLGGVVVLAVLQIAWVRQNPPAVKVLGLRQMALGVALVLVTAAGVGLT